jgi:Concanavalin A-like lectin/glucanases superfamily/Putative binding domain, N-terminal
METAMNRVGVWILICSIIGALLFGIPFNTSAQAAGDSIGAVAPSSVLRNQAAFVDTWDAMVSRDQNLATAGSMTPQGRAAPLMIPQSPSFSTNVVQRKVGYGALPFAPILAASQTIQTSFEAINKQDELNAFNFYWWPPDTMGAVGPNHFMETLNGAVAIYNKTNAARLSLVTLDTFFRVTIGGKTYPRNDTTDPRVIYDRRSGRWIASTLEFGNPSGQDNHIILAVSASSDPTGTWYKYLVQIGVPNNGSITYFSDYDTLGADDNGVYMAVTIFPSSGSSFAKFAAIEKSQVLSGGSMTAYFFSNITDMYSTPQPSHDLDAIGLTDPEWFVASDPNASYANVTCRTLTWSGTPGSRTPSLSSTALLSTPGFGYPFDVPAQGSSVNINVIDFRLMMATIRSNQLWTCRSVGVDSSGGNSSDDRTACEWLQIDITSGTPALAQSGRVYDNSVSNPRNYFYPAIMVSGQGHVTMGFSGSRSTEYAGAYFAGRLSSDPVGTMSSVVQIKAGEASYQLTDSDGRNRWGDYSYTSLDPNDDMTMWTIQEYAASPSSTWGTWVAKLLAPAPTLNGPGGSGQQGQTGVALNLTGSGFFDPGTGFPNRVSVMLMGGSLNGISNYSITYVSATQVQVSFDISPTASLGTRDIVLTNPDGQSVSLSGGFTVVPNPSCSYLINPTNASYGSGSGNGSVSVTAGSGCGWSAASNAGWITVTSGSGTGNGTVNYSVAANNVDCIPRTGTVTIEGQTFTVTQAAGSGSYSINPTNASYFSTGGNGSVTVTAGSGCGWTAVSNPGWITVTSGSSGTGPGTVNYSVAVNTTFGTRTGTVTVAGQTFTVLQSADELRAYWTFDEGSGSIAYDTSRNNNTGTVANATWTSGIINGALSFDGETTQVTVSNSASLNPVQTITVAAWVNADNWFNTPRILEKGQSDNQYGLFVNPSGQLEFLLSGVTNGTLVTTPPSAGTWHQVSGTYDGFLISLYIDGQLAAQQSASGPLPSTTDGLAIGNRPSGNVLYKFSGVIDDVRIYGSALSASQIAQLYDTDSVGDGIANWWRQQYFGNGSTTAATTCATCDFDGTGQNNLFKYVTGLDPTDPTSVFYLQIANVTNQAAQQNLLFNPLASGRKYTPQYSTDLVSGIWLLLAGYSGPVTNGNQVTITDLNATQSRKFYRIDITYP